MHEEEPPPPALLRWIDDRIGLEQLSGIARKKTVPVHRHDVWYYVGGITLLFFVVQMFTGLLLLVYYSGHRPKLIHRVTSYPRRTYRPDFMEADHPGTRIVLSFA